MAKKPPAQQISLPTQSRLSLLKTTSILIIIGMFIPGFAIPLKIHYLDVIDSDSLFMFVIRTVLFVIQPYDSTSLFGEFFHDVALSNLQSSAIPFISFLVTAGIGFWANRSLFVAIVHSMASCVAILSSVWLVIQTGFMQFMLGDVVLVIIGLGAIMNNIFTIYQNRRVATGNLSL